MWFKNICLFKLVEPFQLTVEQLNEKLQVHASRTCGKLERMTYGWSSPLNDDSEFLVHKFNNVLLLCAQKEEKILPNSVIRDHVKLRVKEIEAEQSRSPGKREQRSLFDEVALTLLPRAFSKAARLYGYIDLTKGWLIIDTASKNRAEEFASLLRKSLGSLKLELPIFQQSLILTMTNWLLNQSVPPSLTLEDACDIQDPDHQASIIRCAHQDVCADEIINHLQAGKKITKLALTWSDRVTFTLDSDFALKRIRFLDVIREENADIEAETAEEQFAANASIFTAEFRLLIDDLSELFGGFASMNLHDLEKIKVV